MQIFNIIDAPGCKDYAKNIISGTSMADAALLIIDSIRGNFEADFSNNSWASEHVLLAQTMGVK